MSLLLGKPSAAARESIFGRRGFERRRGIVGDHPRPMSEIVVPMVGDSHATIVGRIVMSGVMRFGNAS